MPNQYSIEIHSFLSNRIREAELALKAANVEKHRAYYSGRLDQLINIRKYLKENVDLKDFTYY